MSVWRAFRRTQERAMKLKRVYAKFHKNGSRKETARLEGPTKGIAAEYRYPAGRKVEWVRR